MRFMKWSNIKRWKTVTPSILSLPEIRANTHLLCISIYLPTYLPTYIHMHYIHTYTCIHSYTLTNIHTHIYTYIPYGISADITLPWCKGNITLTCADITLPWYYPYMCRYYTILNEVIVIVIMIIWGIRKIHHDLPKVSKLTKLYSNETLKTKFRRLLTQIQSTIA